MSFSALGLMPEIVRAVAERGYETPTPIQAQAIPAVMSGGDLLGGAQTGTGKTAGFVLPILHRLMQQRAANNKPTLRALILTPTRELAAQVEDSVKHYGKYLPLSSMVMFGGVNIKGQLRELRAGIDILVATPGRLLDHVQQQTLDLSKIDILVLDEADRMLDMGFIRDIKRIMAIVPKKRQTLLFSATFSNEIKSLADNLLNKPITIEVARRNAANTLITQKAYGVDRERKRDLLIQLLKQNNWQQVLVFTRTKHSANRLSETLIKHDISSMAIHGNKSQSARTTALQSFKDGSLRVLVATDIAARGIDISELPHVINFELPNVAEDYVHRIGRTGRAGNAGEALSLVCIDEFKLWAGIEKLIKQSIPLDTFPGFAIDPTIAAKPIVNGGTNGSRAQGGKNQPKTNAQHKNTTRKATPQGEKRRQPRHNGQASKGGNPPHSGGRQR